MRLPEWELDLLKLRLDYAWKWFSFHADQRTKMFNFMLIVVGIFATAVVAAVKEGMLEVAFWLCLVPGLLAFVFALLDRRNRDLVWLGEDVLRELEKKRLFGEDAKILISKDKEVPFGILWRQRISEPPSSDRPIFSYLKDALLGKHRVWLRVIAVLISAFFLIGAWVIRGNAQETGNREASRWFSSLGHLPENEHRYGAIIDAGSTGSRLSLFEWRKAGNGDPHVWPVVSVAGKDSQNKQCPLSDFSKNTEKDRICTCLRTLTRRGREEAVRFLGEPNLPVIALWVKATAGVRYLSGTDQADILQETNRCLDKSASYNDSSSYAWRGAKVISGPEEGMYAWLAVNHVASTLRNNSPSTYGIVEVGGKSAQIAFRVPARTSPIPTQGEILEVPLASGVIHIYSFSGRLGKDVVKDSLTDVGKDCVAKVNRTKCLVAIDTFLCNEGLGRKACAQHKSLLTPPNNMRFTGLSNFTHVTRNMGLANLTLNEVRVRAETICRARYDRSLRDQFQTPAGIYKVDVCLDALYVTQLAENGWGVPLDAVSPPDPQWASDPSWPLGAMIFEVAASTRAGR